MDNYSAPNHEKRAAQSLDIQAREQLNLLQNGDSTQSGDFYTYRYLATEGFLPGYNFPRLPLRAFIPSTSDGRGKQVYLHRPRFLALSEFGPRSLVYHEGRAYRVVRAMVTVGSRDASKVERRLPTQSVRICAECGAGHFQDHTSMCHACGVTLDKAEIVANIFRIENVGTRPAERITANDEERQRQGFELQTTFEWAMRDQKIDVRTAVALDSDGAVARLHYGPGATITRINKGLRRRADRKRFGFMIDPVSGNWAPNEEEGEQSADPTATQSQLVVPSVRDHKNALLLQPSVAPLSLKAAATVQHALRRGIEAVFQLEEGEILAEPLPKQDQRNGFLFYEATEGGAGVLTRLHEPTQLSAVAKAALRMMHLAISDRGPPPPDLSQLDDVPLTSCVAACYRCLMSYYNQPDHELLDRRDEQARNFLLRLAHAQTTALVPTPDAMGKKPSPASAQTAVADAALARWHRQASTHAIPSSDSQPLVDGRVSIPLCWRSHYVAATIEPISAALGRKLESKGFEVISFGTTETAWPEAFRRLAAALGRAS